ncbi:MAG: hypothetical protein ACJAZX_000865 [Rickettsiales bacterium]|jgi:hypothetical protein
MNFEVGDIDLVPFFFLIKKLKLFYDIRQKYERSECLILEK